MSSALVESDLPGSQLYFPWTGADEVAVPVATKVAADAEVPSAGMQDISQLDRAGQFKSQAVLTQPMSTQPDRSRLGQPVRMGTMMIKLLKRYGITDAEIAEGLESYARKTCQQAAG